MEIHKRASAMALKIIGNNPVASKVFMIGLIVLLLMIPLMMLKGLISERTGMRDQAYRTVADGWGGRVTTGGPMLRVPFDTTEKDKDGKVVVTRHQLYVLPTKLSIDAKIEEETEPRHVGIYKVPVYQVRLTLRGGFIGKAIADSAEYTGDYHWDQARLRLPLSDVRTVRELSLARLGATELKFTPADRGAYSAIEADVDLSRLLTEENIEFAIDIKLAGSQALSLLPLAAVTDVQVQSTWPHPQFQGAFLPAERTITDKGFTASWQVLELNRNFRQSWINGDVDDNQLLAAAFGVELFQSVDVYQRSERAVKYALMFVALTFLSFYAWELLSGTAIHPMQYLFIGLALSTFYLLLIALSEHMAFVIAYWLGAGALVALLGSYIAGAFSSSKQGALVASLMALVYGLLYMLVLSESYALLMGAIALFTVLAVVMLATRRVKWYASET
jgi:inner membrane protein